MRILIALFVIGCGIGSLSIWTSTRHREAPEILGIGQGFTGNDQLPADKVRSTFMAARNEMLDVNTTGVWLHGLAIVLAFASFLVTTLLSMLAAAKAWGKKDANAPGLDHQTTKAVSILAALAAGFTAGGNALVARSQDYFKRADAIHDYVVHAQAQVKDAKTADEAQAVLDDVKMNVPRL